jgi:hypothetical protein
MPARHRCHLLPVRPTNPYAPLGPSTRRMPILGGFDGTRTCPFPIRRIFRSVSIFAKAWE